jgi:hypothetical protein
MQIHTPPVLRSKLTVRSEFTKLWRQRVSRNLFGQRQRRLALRERRETRDVSR